MKINLNDTVKVKLTDEGVQILAREHKRLRESLLEKGANDVGEFVLRLDMDGYYSIQLWSLIEKFSDNIGLLKSTVIVDNDIIIPPKYTTR